MSPALAVGGRTANVASSTMPTSNIPSHVRALDPVIIGPASEVGVGLTAHFKPRSFPLLRWQSFLQAEKLSDREVLLPVNARDGKLHAVEATKCLHERRIEPRAVSAPVDYAASGLAIGQESLQRPDGRTHHIRLRGLTCARIPHPRDHRNTTSFKTDGSPNDEGQSRTIVDHPYILIDCLDAIDGKSRAQML